MYICPFIYTYINIFIYICICTNIYTNIHTYIYISPSGQGRTVGAEEAVKFVVLFVDPRPRLPPSGCESLSPGYEPLSTAPGPRTLGVIASYTHAGRIDQRASARTGMPRS